VRCECARYICTILIFPHFLFSSIFSFVSCLRKFCDCFASGVSCSPACKCSDCANLPPEDGGSADTAALFDAAADTVDASTKAHQLPMNAEVGGDGDGDGDNNNNNSMAL